MHAVFTQNVFIGLREDLMLVLLMSLIYCTVGKGSAYLDGYLTSTMPAHIYHRPMHVFISDLHNSSQWSKYSTDLMYI